jgi:hypothetical protein
MHPRERVSYSAIKDRKPLKLPDGLRLIVWPVLASRLHRSFGCHHVRHHCARRRAGR